MKVRVSEHQGVSPRIEKPVKGLFQYKTFDHMFIYNH